MPSRIRFSTLWSLLIAINLIGLLIIAVWFRCQYLGNIPGLNGDEAQYGVRAIQLIRGTLGTWRTPMGNPLNPFFIGPLAILHLWFDPSIVVLRSVALASGLMALVLNWTLCRWVYDNRTAWISTAILSVLPINIAYSRFAWDASQSLAATLPVVYLSLAAIRFPQRKSLIIGAAIICQIVAIIVHPTNIFTAIFIIGALLVHRNFVESSFRNILKHPFVIIALLTLCILIGVWIIFVLPNTPAWRLLLPEGGINNFYKTSIFCPRLFMGGTIYRYLAGSYSWFQWPWYFDSDRFGVDAIIFWLLALIACTLLWRSWKSAGRIEDGLLLAGWVLLITSFFILAGPRAMRPGYERWSICLIAPTVILACRAMSLVCSWNVVTKRLLLLTTFIAGWLILADFNAHYFRFIQTNVGLAEWTFRTAQEEPKVTALKYVLEHRQSGETLIVTSTWWNYWPLMYFSMKENNLSVLMPKEEAGLMIMTRLAEDIRFEKDDEKFASEIKAGRVWAVEFSAYWGELQKFADKIQNQKIVRKEIKDYGGQAVLTILHPE